ncbi:PAS domain-containing sensor histidine kinase [Elizabethkingia meningoseptica]|uniref:HAMP domain-containing sensor histidine kinase n=1 Tax=Elizabethkingia meningoseptica TaxID=238 RepID=UPI000332C011|nr:ATP-binding protein [Elizabethkingia meningoseptica]AQX06573.1 PAS domain-containing sensor histidine kinase [Elizabethkingia meningoseptica]AQX48620.1 PAS domain-containing sensor histidine kinase [Elizabethkingia meningoseptica]EOR29390.1 multi-sensor signal transduction histidine kinase [Elizabethkingia meningoseptica ATCC 13253 = NBRC 12535]KUY13674.1 PAS domain-containing sensor histidine kinase [Elizabethkingia meningoseptica]OPB75570.1 PAS domain-containing sensor histidine kinase [E
MKLKTKLTLGVGLLFLLIVLLSVIGALYINKLKSDTEKILTANYNSLEYAKNMMLALDKIDTDSARAVKSFEKNNVFQDKNLTEPGEKEASERLSIHFKDYLQNKTAIREKQIRNDLATIMSLNMKAIERKSDIAIVTAGNATFWIVSLGTVCFMIAFTLLFNLPQTIAEPIRQLTSSIRQIADRNYHERVHFKGSEEFNDLANSFNVMAEKLEEYESSNLSKQLMDKKRIETLVNNMHDAVIGLDENHFIYMINDQALKITNLRKEDLVGKTAHEVSVNNDLLRELLKNIDHPSEEPIKIVADKKESYFEQEVIPISIIKTGEKEKKNIGKVILLRNITPFKELDFAKTNFIATISHELKTPIAAIKMGVQLLGNQKFGDLNEQQQELLKGIDEDGHRLLTITSELLNLSQVETGNIRLNIESCNPAELVYTAAKNVEMLAEQKNIRIITEIKINTEDQVAADFDKTVWVINNFLSNAIKHSFQEENIRMVVEKADKMIRFSISDSGKGIDEKYHRQIFDRYFQVPGEHQSGTGLGLAISKNFIEKQHGEIGVSSSLNEGSTFYFTLPASDN